MKGSFKNALPKFRLTTDIFAVGQDIHEIMLFSSIENSRAEPHKHGAFGFLVKATLKNQVTEPL